MQTTDSIDQPTTMYAFVVLYNMAVNGSKTCEALEHIVGHDIRVLVIDNSTRDLGNEAVCGGLGWHYLSMHGNAGLSKAYNIGLDLLKSRGDEGIVILLDDDSNVTQEYFDELEADLRDHPDVDIFVGAKDDHLNEHGYIVPGLGDAGDTSPGRQVLLSELVRPDQKPPDASGDRHGASETL